MNNLNQKIFKKIDNEKNICKNQNKSFIKNKAIIILFLLIAINSKINHPIFIGNNSYIDYSNNSSDRWIVMNAFNPPSESIINLEKNINNWKIIVIGNCKTEDSYWNIFIRSRKLIYLSIEEQNKLGYKILKFLKNDSYCRKNIGYLYAIQQYMK